MSAPRTDRQASRAALAFVVLAVLVGLLWESSPRQVSDLGLYRVYSSRIYDGLIPYRDFAVEYPPGALVAFVVPGVFGSGQFVYGMTFVLVFAALGGVGVVLCDRVLRREAVPTRERTRALVFLALMPLALGSLLTTRFDLFPAVLVLLVLMALLANRYTLAGALLGAAIAVKLYPAVILPVVVAYVWHQADRRTMLRFTGLVALVPVVAYLPFALLAPSGVAQSIGRQASRPLQIESLGSSLLLALHHVTGLDVEWASGRGSQNLVGTLPRVLEVVASIAVVGAIALVCWWFVRAGCRRSDLVTAATASVLAFVALGKVLSPQFLIWLVFPVALVSGSAGRRAQALLVVACVATFVYFPARYWLLVKEYDPVASWALLVRNIALVAALVLLVMSLRPREPAA